MQTTLRATESAAAARSGALVARRALAVVLGAAVVAVAAQFAIPVGVVPVSLQGGAVLLVGGLLGRRYGAAALVTYLTLGAAGLPVFANGGFGLVHLAGPTAGYLVAFPAAAAVAGWLARPGSVIRSTGAALAGMALIHVGGLAWLTIALGSATRAFALGTQPFLLTDLLQVAVAGGLVALLGARVRRSV